MCGLFFPTRNKRQAPPPRSRLKTVKFTAMVLLEYDDKPWTTREWVSIYSKEKFGIFLVESGLYWAQRIDPSSRRTVYWPALIFSALASTIDYKSLVVKPIEFVMDGLIAFVNYEKLTAYENWEQKMGKMGEELEAVREATERLVERQAGLQMMMDTPSILYGCRVKVYRTYGIAQWYTAVIVGFNDATQIYINIEPNDSNFAERKNKENEWQRDKVSSDAFKTNPTHSNELLLELTLMDDTVLEEHFEDPRLVHMKILGDGVVNGILRGENVGTRRRPTSRYGASSIPPQTDKNARPNHDNRQLNRSEEVAQSTLRSNEDISILQIP
ncbi:unnamed protein product [Bemisia tabaci]|uniref:Uncharacterized protein n=1 Tax=Bemisia tabaci TaxID=7038 RepID=A0A9P0F768_BEMTA|nr:unnamed protein product [Bemisia tabaci]